MFFQLGMKWTLFSCSGIFFYQSLFNIDIVYDACLDMAISPCQIRKINTFLFFVNKNTRTH